MKFFDIDSSFMQGLTKFANLMFLNVMTLLLCIPVVTAGAALTAMHYVALKMVRDEDCYIFKDYFKSFKTNFKQATMLWILVIFTVVLLAGDFYILNHVEGLAFSNVWKVIIMVIALLVAFTLTFLFPTLAKFDNSVPHTIKNAFAISVLQLPKTILMILLNILPIVLAFSSMRLFPLVLFFGMSAPAYAGAFLYNKFFKRLEEQILAATGDGNVREDAGEDERIFHDELDVALTQKDDLQK